MAGHEYRGRVVRARRARRAAHGGRDPAPGGAFSDAHRRQPPADRRLPRAVRAARARLRDLREPGAHRPDRHLPRGGPAPLARRLQQLVPVEGSDEFAAARPRVQRHVGAARGARSRRSSASARSSRRRSGASGDALRHRPRPPGVVALAVRQAVDACEAEVGRALPLARGALAALRGRRGRGRARGGDRGGGARRVRDRRRRGARAAGRARGRRRAPSARGAPCRRSAGGAHALSIGLRSLVDGPEYLGAISIARARRAFTPRGGASCSSTWPGRRWCRSRTRACTRRSSSQAVTDELTGLVNVRALPLALDREIERCRRFEHAARAHDARHRRLQARERHLRPPAGRRGARAGGAACCGRSRATSTSPARYGGEEMAVILPQTDVAGAELLARAHAGGGGGAPGPAARRRRVADE